MEEVIKTIKETLYQHGQVCLPELGCLQVQYRGAQIHAAIHKISPPTAKIVFTTDTQADKWLLQESLQKQTNLPASEVDSLLKNLSTTIKIELGTHKKFTIPELGTFKLQYDESIEFEQDPDINYLPDAFGLPEVFGQVVVRSEEEAATLQQAFTTMASSPGSTADEELPTLPQTKERNWGGILVIASLFIIALFASYVLFIDPSLNPFNALFGTNNQQAEAKTTNEESLAENPDATEITTEETAAAEPLPLDEETATATTKEEVAKEETSSIEENSTAANNWNYESNNTSPTPTQKTQPTATNTTPTPQPVEDYNKAVEFYTVNSPQNQYFVIAGSFTNKLHAYKAAEQFFHKGLKKTRVIVSDGRYRVAVGFDADKEKADSLRIALQQRLGKNDLWILKY
jgi:nucleoid DNA-binding protein/cell division septation protein DedD